MKTRTLVTDRLVSVLESEILSDSVVPEPDGEHEIRTIVVRQPIAPVVAMELVERNYEVKNG